MKLIIILLISTGLAFARVNVDINVGIPIIPVVVEQPAPEPEEPDVVFEGRPSITLIMPGIYVVPNYRTEVFCVSGIYWTQHHNHWYRYSEHRRHWAVSDNPPHSIVKLPRGKYKHWKPAPKGMTPLHKEHGNHEDHGNHGEHGNHEKRKD